MLPALALALIACDADSDGRRHRPDAVTTDTSVDGVVLPQVVFAEGVPQVVRVQWTSPVAAEGHVVYGLAGEELALRTPEVVSREHDHAVLGLKAGRAYDLRAVQVIHGEAVTSEVLRVDVPAVEGLPALELVRSEPGSAVAGGFVLVGWLWGGRGAIGIVDGDGDWVWARRMPAGSMTASPHFSPRGPWVMWDEYAPVGPYGAVEGIAHQSRLDGSGEVNTAVGLGHHAIVEVDDQTLAWLSADVVPYDGGGVGQYTMTDVLLERPLRTENVWRPVVNLRDDWIVEPFEHPCIHTRLPLQQLGYPEVIEYTHSNSLIYLEDDDSYLLNTRWTDALLAIERDGTIRWQLGGPGGDFTAPDGSSLYDGANGSVLFSHSHLSQAWDGGFVAFDNGSHHAPPTTSIVEIAYDEDTMTAWEVFRYAEPTGRFIGILGDVRKLDGGSYLVSWSTAGALSEVSPSGEELWRLEARAGASATRLDFTTDLYGVGLR